MNTTAFPGYLLIERLWEDGEFILYRGRQENDLSPVLVVTPILERPEVESLKQLEHEHDLKARLDSAWAARPLTLTHPAGRTALILEDPGGEPLSRFTGQPLPLTRFLSIAANLAAALGRVHDGDLIHKDIKPANILVDVTTGQVRLIGFGIASRLPREHQISEPPEVIAGTLAYMAPEQTGRMNRSIDSRSDLYSLGVTLYELLTGVLPFTASEPLEWIHCHVAQQPASPTEHAPDIPQPLADIIMKLLAKTAEERYQTATGLEVDLRRCLAEWESLGRIEPFSLAAHDISDRLQVPEKLYGRRQESHFLLEAFERVVAQGTAELVLVAGPAGAGKSSLVDELHRVIVRPRGLFISGKFDQYRQDVPYDTVAQAFRVIIRQILSKSDQEVQRWRESIRVAAGSNGRLLIDLIPELEHIIGPQPSVPELPPQEAQNRFQALFARFLAIFARPDHCLILFLDDLQWLDAATLKLIKYLITHPDLRHFLLIGAYRDNEVGPTHPLSLTLDAIHQTKTIVHRLLLAPLLPGDVGQLVADALRCEPATAAPLARLIYDKTAGNPFFTIHFLTALPEEQLLKFDASTAAWQWDMEQIQAKGFTDNVVELMVGRLKRLPSKAQELLKLAACLGNQVSRATLALVYGRSVEETHADLWPAIHGGLLLYLDERHGQASYHFLHDRVQEASYFLIPVEQRAATHLMIGRLLAAPTPARAVQGKLFDIVNQFNQGLSQLTDPRERVQVTRLNLQAGRQARASTAYVSAGDYFAAGISLLAPNSWASHYELTYGLYFGRAECTYLNGDFTEAEQLSQTLLAQARTSGEKSHVYLLLIDLYTTTGRFDQALAAGNECLHLLGVELPLQPTTEQVDVEERLVWQLLGERPVEALIDLPLVANPEMEAALAVLTAMHPSSYFTGGSLNLFLFIPAFTTNLSLRHGNAPASAMAYATFGTIICHRFGKHQEAYRFGKLACDLVNDSAGNSPSALTYRSKIYFLMGNTINSYTHQHATSLAYLARSYQAAVETGDLTFACYACLDRSIYLFLKGSPLNEVSREVETCLGFVRQAKFNLVVDMLVSLRQLLQALGGHTLHLGSFDSAGFQEGAFEDHLDRNFVPIAFCWYYVYKLQARFLAGDNTGALQVLERLSDRIPMVFGDPVLPEYYFYAGLVTAATYEQTRPEERPAAMARLVAARQKLDEWAASCPANFQAQAMLLAAEHSRLQGLELEAMGLYEEAIRAARATDFIHLDGLSNELAARFYFARGYETIAQTYLRNARYGYLRWGAVGKLKQLDRHYPHQNEPEPLYLTTTIGATVKQMDLMTVIKAAQAVSGEIVLGDLIKTLMGIALEHAGAQRGLLILPHGKGYNIQAEATINRQKVEVFLKQAVVTPADLPESVLHYVIRTQESVILDDATATNLFSADSYIHRSRPRSVLCLPLVKQTKLAGVLYLENNLAPNAFTLDHLAVLNILASQSAISLENARLYLDLQQENDSRTKAETGLRASEEALQARQHFLALLNDITRAALEAPNLDTMLQLLAERLGELLNADGTMLTLWDEATDTAIPAATSFPEFRDTFLSGAPAPGEATLTASALRAGRALVVEELSLSPDISPRLAARLPYRSLLALPLIAGRQKLGAILIAFKELHRFTPEEIASGEQAARLIALAMAKVRLLDELEQRVDERTRELAEAISRLKELDQLKDEFVANVSHDLRTPLASVNLYLDLLEKRRAEALDHYLPILRRETRRLTSLIEDLLTLSRLEQLSVTLPLEPQVLDSLLTDVLQVHAVQAANKELQLIHIPNPDVPPIPVDYAQMMQVFTNLIGNAVAYTSPGGRITCKVALAGADEVLISVSNNGPAIPPEDLPYLFERFYRGRTARQSGESGTGLGLAICREIVLRHGGRIEVESEEGGETTFRIWLPIL